MTASGTDSPRAVRRSVGTVTVWQTVASVCFYTVFAGTALFRTAFDLSGATTGLVVTVLMVGYALTLFPAGAVVDGVGEKPAMVGGLLGLGAALVGVALAPSYGWLLAAVFALGVAYATAIPGTNRAIVTTVPPGSESLAMGVKQVGVTAGSGISAVLVTGLAERFGWRAGFLAAAALGGLALVGFAALYRGTPGSGGVSLPNPRWLFEDRTALLLLGTGFLLGAALFTTTGYVTVYATDAVGVSLAVGGWMLALTQVTGSAGRVAFGGLVDRLPGSTAVAAGRVLRGEAAAAGAFLFAVALADAPLPSALAFAGLGVALLGFTGVYYSCLTAIVPEGKVGEATAGGQSALTAGAVVTPPAFGALADGVGYAVAWGGLGVVCLLAAVAAGAVLRRLE